MGLVLLGYIYGPDNFGRNIFWFILSLYILYIVYIINLDQTKKRSNLRKVVKIAKRHMNNKSSHLHSNNMHTLFEPAAHKYCLCHRLFMKVKMYIIFMFVFIAFTLIYIPRGNLLNVCVWVLMHGSDAPLS